MYGATKTSWGISEGLYKGLVMYGISMGLYGCISEGLYKGFIDWLFKCLLILKR